MRTVLFDNQPYMRGWKEIRNGDCYAVVETGPAITAFPLRRGDDGDLEILLIKEHRLSGMERKSIGRFLKDCAVVEACRKALFDEAGIIGGRLCLLSKMTGFEIVRLPIIAFTVFDWLISANGRAERLIMTLDVAVHKVLSEEITELATVEGILRIDALAKRNQLDI